MDSDSESSSDEQPLVRSASVPSDTVSALEHDLISIDSDTTQS